MQENWKSIFGGDYEVSDHGRVRRVTPGRRTHAGKMLTLTELKIGYYKVSPVVDGKNKQMYVHHLVAEAFIGPRPEGMSVNHKDGDKKNNTVTNLEYVTHRQNMRHARDTGLTKVGQDHGGAKFSNADVSEMRKMHAEGIRNTDIQKRFGASAATVSQIVNNRRRKDEGSRSS